MTNEIKIAIGAIGVAIIIIAIDLLFLKIFGLW